MSHQKIDVTHEPTMDLFKPAHEDREDYDPMDVAGPGGRTTNIEHNEKGILESGLFRVMDKHEEAPLGSSHDSHAQGIYTTHFGPKYHD